MTRVMTTTWNRYPDIHIEIHQVQRMHDTAYARLLYRAKQLVSARYLTEGENKQFLHDPFAFFPLDTKEIKAIMTGQALEITDELKDINNP